jgi:hypothetical protein
LANLVAGNKIVAASKVNLPMISLAGDYFKEQKLVSANFPSSAVPH